jgi:arylsulfatase A-like enzyme
VILLAWDGVRYDFPDRVRLAGLARMEREGVRAQRLVPPYPSSTFPSMVTLATGTYPDRHGIVDNHFHDRVRGEFSREADPSWIEAEPLWITAERQGVPSAVYFWVGSEADWRGRGARHKKAPFDSDVGEAAKVDEILGWLDLPPAERPRLIMAWWHGTDHVGHMKGPDHEDIASQLVAQDEELERLLAGIDARGLWDRTTVLVVSDHGMTRVDETVPVRATLTAAGVEAEVTPGAAIAHVFLADETKLDAAERALAALEGVTVHRRDRLPTGFRFAHPSRTGDLVLTVAPPRTFAMPGLGGAAWNHAGRLLGWERGMHGFDPDLPDMGGILFALGRGVPRGARIGEVRAIDVAPTAAVLLGIEPPSQAEGEPLRFASGEPSTAAPASTSDADRAPHGSDAGAESLP